MVTTVKPLVVIVGETASGKSTLAMELARRNNGEIISADSRAVYKYIDIGSAKPSKQDQAEIPHHLLDVVEPNQRFSAAQYKGLAVKAIKEINNRGHLPILVGGTGLYINSVIFDYKFKPLPKKGLREALNSLTSSELKKRVQEAGDLEIDTKNRRHMIRFLESGSTKHIDSKLRKNTILTGVKRSRSEMRKRIEKRTEAMFRSGLRREVDFLVSRYGWSGEAMTGNVYKLFKEYEDGKLSMTEVKRKNVLRDLQLAKRQRTWFKRNRHIKWHEDSKAALAYIESSIVDTNTTI